MTSSVKPPNVNTFGATHSGMNYNVEPNSSINTKQDTERLPYKKDCAVTPFACKLHAPRNTTWRFTILANLVPLQFSSGGTLRDRMQEQ